MMEPKIMEKFASPTGILQLAPNSSFPHSELCQVCGSGEERCPLLIGAAILELISMVLATLDRKHLLLGLQRCEDFFLCSKGLLFGRLFLGILEITETLLTVRRCFAWISPQNEENCWEVQVLEESTQVESGWVWFAKDC